MRGVVWHVYVRLSRQDVFFDTRREAFSWVHDTFADPVRAGVLVARNGPDDDYIVRDFANPSRQRMEAAPR